jgi:hypothetical protein
VQQPPPPVNHPPSVSRAGENAPTATLVIARLPDAFNETEIQIQRRWQYQRPAGHTTGQGVK